MTQQQYPHLPRSISLPSVAGMLRVLALLGLFLLPMQMRAGTTYVHPHALLHLLLDAADREIDHHHAAATPVHGHGDHSDHAPRSGGASSDLPTFESIQMAAGGLAVTLVTLSLFFVASRQERVWPHREVWSGLRLRPEFPPPRPCGAV
jgi:hypothetical protein